MAFIVHNRLVNSRWHAYAMDASTGLCYIIANLSLLRLKGADSLHDSDIAATPGFVCMNTAPLADRRAIASNLCAGSPDPDPTPHIHAQRKTATVRLYLRSSSQLPQIFFDPCGSWC